MVKLGRLQLIQRRERWVLTAQSWLILLCLAVVLLWGLLPRIYPFFAVVQPITADALVIEGWVTDDNLEDAAQEFRSRPYQYLLTTGAKLSRGHYLSQYKTYAELSAATLVKLGIEADRVIAIPSPKVKRDRTYASAVTLQEWLDQNPGKIQRINLMSPGVHARRSWTLFQKALGTRAPIGIIAIPDRDYSGKRWWASSEGAKKVIFEAIGYIYATVFNLVE
ncbi:YdcF family protein [filamentous cyanobacterium LEGE 11480]|uniref:YdcF family protein n=1 Tax=Romeriopsis navalis LEGE 11480 TaxID=2777977 RepID=A0A928VU15_9CYAN|nr:YdcF family protein [Romeriopsis navalis LEGE 11480]